MTLSLKATSETNAHTQSRLVTNVRFQLQLQLRLQLSDSNSNFGRFPCVRVWAKPCPAVLYTSEETASGATTPTGLVTCARQLSAGAA